MPYSVRYTPAAAAEVANAILWYDQSSINQAASFVGEMERTEAHLTSRPSCISASKVKSDVLSCVAFRTRCST